VAEELSEKLSRMTVLREQEKIKAMEQKFADDEKLTKETNTRDSMIKRLQKSNFSLEFDLKRAKEQLAEVTENEEKLSIKHKKLKDEYAQLKSQFETASRELTEHKQEKEGLIKTALAAQEDQRKLAVIMEKYETKPEEFVKLMFGDLSFANMVRSSSKNGQVKKQGGKNNTKWQKRFLVLNGSFLLYYASTEDKEPKGVVRLDNESVVTSKCDLSKLKMEHAFTIVKKDKTSRAYFFSCVNEEECTGWVRVILQAQGWPMEEVTAYLTSDHEVKTEVKKGTLRKGKLNE